MPAREAACRLNRDPVVPTWLGLGRDMRLTDVRGENEFTSKLVA